MSDKKYTLYILECWDSSFYTGITTDLSRRFQEHSKWEWAKYTRGRLPLRLVYKESFENRSTASKAELHIKSLSREDKQKIINNFKK